jgi:hypothetical protein
MKSEQTVIPIPQRAEGEEARTAWSCVHLENRSVAPTFITANGNHHKVDEPFYELIY